MAKAIPKPSMKGSLMNHSSFPSTRLITRLALASAALYLGACINSPDENTIIDPAYANTKVDAHVAGQTLASNFQMGQDWNSTTTAPTNVKELGTLSTKVGTLNKVASLAKTAGLANVSDIDLGNELKINLEDTAKGYAVLYKESKLPLVNTKDTAIVKWDAIARDTSINDKNIISFKRVSKYATGKIEMSEFTDGDNDGLITPKAGKESLMRIKFAVIEKEVTEKTSLLVGAGPDANFENEMDNQVKEATWTKTRGGIVIGQGAYLDADGDGIVSDNTKDCKVEVKYSDMEPKDHPLAKTVTFDAKIKILAHKMGDEPITFGYEEELLNGRVNTVTIKNRAGGPEFVRGDTMTVRLETSLTSVEDTLKHAVIEFIMNPGQDLKSDLDDSCYAIHITTEKKFGFERSSEFNFVSKTAIPHGQEPTEGTFDGKATYANGKTAKLKGSFSPTGFSAEYTGPEGGTAKAEFSATGNLTSGGSI